MDSTAGHWTRKMRLLKPRQKSLTLIPDNQIPTTRHKQTSLKVFRHQMGCMAICPYICGLINPLPSLSSLSLSAWKLRRTDVEMRKINILVLSSITSRTDFGQQMRSRELPAYLSLNRLFNGILSYFWCYFVQIRPNSQKFNSCVTEGRTDGQTDIPFYRDARTHLKTTGGIALTKRNKG